MYFTTHALVGGFCSGLLDGPIRAFVGGMVSHIVLDALPHHDYPRFAWGILDVLTGVSLVFCLREKFSEFTYFIPGAIGGALPDLEVVLNHLSGGGRRLFFPSHTGLTPHPRWRWPWGFFSQVLVVCFVIVCYLWNR